MKKALVTGASGQIGKAIVRKLLEADYFVYAHSSNKKSSFLLEKELSSFKNRCKYISLDAEIISEELILDKEFKEVDILVNAIGGGGSHESWTSTTLDKWEFIYKLNVITPVFFIKSVIEKMKEKKKGNIINISSVSAIKTLNIGPEYSAAKAALVNLSQSLAQECKNSNITVNCISPGLVYTENVKELMCKKFNLENEEDILINNTISEKFFPNLIGTLPTPSDIAELVYFLTLEGAKNITGQNLIIDSGYSLSNYVDSSVE